MSVENAQHFLSVMREDQTLRQQVRSAATKGELTAFCRKNGIIIELHHLVVAMADCMEELAQQGDSEKTNCIKT